MGADERGRVLLHLARTSLTEALGLPPPPPTAEVEDEAPAPWLSDPGATFVTLHKDGSLRGCIGSVNAYRPLADDVRENARAAAFSDYRFPPVTPEELPRLHLEVSLLSDPAPLAVASEAEAWAALRPGVDGVILECAGRRSTFLPQVWEQLPEPRDFLAHLKHKAGLPRRFWSPDVQLWRYTVEKWEEPPADPRAAG